MNEKYLPEPLDNNVVGTVAVLVLCILSPVIHVHVSQTTHEQLWSTETSHYSLSSA